MCLDEPGRPAGLESRAKIRVVFHHAAVYGGVILSAATIFKKSGALEEHELTSC